MVREDESYGHLKGENCLKLRDDEYLELPTMWSCVTIPKAKRMDEVTVYLRTIAREMDVMEEIFAIFEDPRACCEFSEEGATEVTLIPCKFDTEC